MVYSTDSEMFTVPEMKDGTAETWVKTLTITAFKAGMVTMIGSGAVLYTILYE